MGKINGCLKCLFIFFNVLFAIIGCLLIFGIVKASAVSGQFSTVGTPGIGWGWVFAIGVLGISCLGIYAGCSEKPLALKIFAGFMVAGMVVMLIFGIYVAVTRNKLKDGFTNVTSEISKTYMEHPEFRAMLDGLQSSAECCGLSKPEDWGSTIPDSCSCSGPSTYGGYGCKSRPQGTSGPDQIYATSCGKYLFDVIDIVMKVLMGFCFGFAVTALLGLLVTLLMLHQVKQHDGDGPTMSMKNY
ncbi:hypothetical protein NQD34_017007 [Periophthalmus magnuspinnatus]|uniref:leukocyte antigen CD37-like n=1 Tax=Periophthalmus magnuspinnatus TaxID=409849 RepID=UPI00145AF1AE|nr:leukocyte antigen CD37-like [Periophthalmus magnuspinnatus]KAJ0012673.1 hypothetical protein NQD34_017007 [Periophthalmus magnuspinnatus]